LADSDRNGQPLSKCLHSLVETVAAADVPQKATFDRIASAADGDAGPVLTVAIVGDHPMAALLKTFAGIKQEDGGISSRPSGRRNSVLLKIELCERR